jgi:hypothetical protein
LLTLLSLSLSFSRAGGEGKATLVLSVDKETYEQLGLEGKKSVFKTTNRYSTYALMQPSSSSSSSALRHLFFT